jgi:hypothetical protein
VLLFGTRSADHIRDSGQSGCIQRPDTWLYPNASLKRQVPVSDSQNNANDPFRYWDYEGCRYDKGSFTCAEPDHIDACPVPRPRLRNGRLNEAFSACPTKS